MAKKVIGIDPHPSKKATIYDPSVRCWRTVESRELPGCVSKMARSDEDLLICWDAPLTMGRAGRDGCYYERQIESFFRGKQQRPPAGISVQAYTRCPHWAVTMASLGLPRIRVRNYAVDPGELPFELCAGGDAPSEGSRRKHVVEVHPAVAIWLWCRKKNIELPTWEYKEKKNKKDVLDKLWESMCGENLINDGNAPKQKQKPENDDEFDAYVGYLLGEKWLGSDGVVLLGDDATGSFLVPAEDKLQNEFESFAESLAKT